MHLIVRRTFKFPVIIKYLAIVRTHRVITRDAFPSVFTFMSQSTSIRQFPTIGRNVCFIVRFDECLIKPCMMGSRRYVLYERFDFSKNNRNVFFPRSSVIAADRMAIGMCMCVHFPIARINIAGSLNS